MVKTKGAHCGKFSQGVLGANMIKQPWNLRKIGVLEELENTDTSLEGLRSSSEDLQTHNRGKEGKFVIKQMKEE